jgi:DNA-binding Lrp family transcriptional regulator
MENSISVFIGVVTEEKVKTAEIIKSVLQVNGVKSAWELTGSFDMLILASSQSVHSLNVVVEAVRACPGVRETTTYLVLESHGDAKAKTG